MASALIVSMPGCSNEPSDEIGSAVELKLKGEIQVPMSGTRVNASGFESNDKVGVYVSSTGSLAPSSNVLDNAAYSYLNGNLVAPEGGKVYWESETTRLAVYAYYPYSTTVEDNSAYEFSVETNQSEPDNFYNSDFITAKAENLAPQDASVLLTFQHSGAKINISLVAGKGITSSELAEADKSFTIEGLITDGTINLATGVATAGSTKATITPLESNGKDYSAIVYPQSGAVTFYMELDGKIFSYTTNVTFASGYQYQFNLIINTWESPEMTINDVAINPWEDGDEHPGVMSGTISFADENLKRRIVDELIYEKDESGWYVPIEGAYVDSNRDGEISYDEAKTVYYLAMDASYILNLSDLQYFTNLEFLVIDRSPISSIDLSAIVSLRSFTIHGSSVASLILSNPNLKYLSCLSNSNLKTLDISGVTALEELECNDNAIESLDVSKNLSLNSVNLSYEKSLSTLYVHSSQNTTDWKLPDGVTPTVKGE